MSKTDKKGILTNRFRQHKAQAKNGNPLPIYNAWRKYGDPVQHVISIHDDRDECELAEIEAIRDLKATDPEVGYNLASGGQGLKYHNNPNLHAYMAERTWNNPEWRKKVSNALKGRKPSQAALDAYKEFCKTPKKSECAKEAWKDPQYRKMKSDCTREQMKNGGADHLRKVLKGRSDVRTESGKLTQSNKVKAWLKTEEGKKTLQKAAKSTWSKPENRAKILGGLDKWRKSERNAEHCKNISSLSSKACSISVIDTESGITYQSQRQMAKALGLSDATISLRVKSGKVQRLNK